MALAKALHDAVSQNPIAYGYSNARVKAMTTHLIQKSQFEEMVRVGNLAGVTEILERTHFKQDIVALSLRHSGSELVLLALGRNKARTYRKLLRITPEGGRDALTAFLRRWDVHNLKTILLGKKMGYPAEKIESLLVPAGQLDERTLQRLMGMDIEGLTVFIRRCDCSPPKEFWAKYNGKDITLLISELERSYYLGLASKVRGVGRDGGTVLWLVKAEIDAKNIMLGIRAVRERIPKESLAKLLIGGGHIGTRELLKLADNKSRDEAVKKLSRHYDLTSAYESFKKDDSLVHFEIALENHIAKRGVNALHRSMLSVGAIIGYVYLKDAEIGNIRKILSAVEYGIPEERLREMLVFAG